MAAEMKEVNLKPKLDSIIRNFERSGKRVENRPFIESKISDLETIVQKNKLREPEEWELSHLIEGLAFNKDKELQPKKFMTAISSFDRLAKKFNIPDNIHKQLFERIFKKASPKYGVKDAVGELLQKFNQITDEARTKDPDLFEDIKDEIHTTFFEGLFAGTDLSQIKCQIESMINLQRKMPNESAILRARKESAQESEKQRTTLKPK
jgi:hypothetical protein